MTTTKTARNSRIKRLREGNPPLPWRAIAKRIAVEFPEDAISHQRCEEIYLRDVKGIRPGSEARRKAAAKG
jgi:hypothetical protein